MATVSAAAASMCALGHSHKCVINVAETSVNAISAGWLTVANAIYCCEGVQRQWVNAVSLSSGNTLAEGVWLLFSAKYVAEIGFAQKLSNHYLLPDFMFIEFFIPLRTAKICQTSNLYSKCNARFMNKLYLDT